MNDDIPELTGSKVDALKLSTLSVGNWLVGYAEGVALGGKPRVGAVLGTAVKALIEIAQRGDCSCPGYARRTLHRMMEEAQ